MRLWSAWVELVERREPAHAVALVRIAVGTTVALHLLLNWRSEAWRWVWLNPEQGGLVKLSRTPFDAWITATPATVEAAILLTATAALVLALGLATPLAAVVAAVGWTWLSELGPNAGGSYDFLVANLLFLLVLAGSGGAWSLDAAIRARRQRSPALAPAWARWLIVWQLVVMYDTTVWQKVSSGWVPGGPLDALWYILQQPTWHRFDMRWVAPFYPLTQLATLGAWCFEHASVLLVLAAFYRHTRTRSGWLRAQFNRVDWRIPYLGFGVLMHLGIELAMEVGPFTYLSLAAYPAAFAGEEVSRFAARFSPRRGTA